MSKFWLVSAIWFVISVLVSVLPLGALFPFSETLAGDAAIIAPVMWAPVVYLFLNLDRKLTNQRLFALGVIGFLFGVCRAYLVCKWVFVPAPSPIVALLVGTTWVGTVSATFAIISGVFARYSIFSAGTMCFLICAMDWVLGHPDLLPIPYLTTAYAAAAGKLVLLAPWVGPFGLSLIIGFSSFGVALTCQKYGIIRGLLAGLIAMFLCHFAPNTFSKWERLGSQKAVISEPVLAIGDPRPISSSLQFPDSVTKAQPHFVVLRESAVIDGKFVTGADGELTLKQLREFSETRFPSAITIAGATLDLGDNLGSYRNGVLILKPGGSMIFRDKRVPVPGCEAAPFSGIPVLYQLLDSKMMNYGHFVKCQNEIKPIAANDLRIGTAVCFDHTLLDTRTAWGVNAQDQTDLLVAVGKLQGLGSSREMEQFESGAARRLHAALLRTTLVYISDYGVDVVTRDGIDRRINYSKLKAALLSVPIFPATGKMLTFAMQVSRTLSNVFICAGLIEPILGAVYFGFIEIGKRHAVWKTIPGSHN